MATTSKRTIQSKGKGRTWLGIIAIVVGLGIVVAGALLYANRNSPRNTKETTAMSQYLSQKYGKPFTVENYRVEGEGLAVDGDPTGDAYPIDNPNLVFKVWDTGNYKSNEHSYSDQYLRALWSSQAKESAETNLTQKLSQVEGITADVYPTQGSRLESYTDLTGKTISLDEALASFGNDVYFSLTVKGKTGTSNEPSMLNLEQAFEVFKYADDKGVIIFSAHYLYRQDNFDQIDDSGQRLYQYSIGGDNITSNSILTADNLRAYFKQIR